MMILRSFYGLCEDILCSQVPLKAFKMDLKDRTSSLNSLVGLRNTSCNSPQFSPIVIICNYISYNLSILPLTGR